MYGLLVPCAMIYTFSCCFRQQAQAVRISLAAPRAFVTPNAYVRAAVDAFNTHI